MARILYKDFNNYKTDVESASADVTTLSNTAQETIEAVKLPNYISLDGDGFSLFDNTVKFYEPTDFVGLQSNTLADAEGNITFELKVNANIDYTKPIKINMYGHGFKEMTVKYSFFTPDGYLDIDSISEETFTLDKDILSFTFTPNRTSLTKEFNHISFNFTKMFMPNARCKIANVIFDNDSVFEIDKIKSTNLIEEISILSDNLPANGFDFSAITEKPIKKNALVNVYSGNTFYGTFYIENVKNTAQIHMSGNTKDLYDVQCTNIIGRMEDFKLTDGGIASFGGLNLMMLFAVAPFADYYIPTVDYKNNLDSYTVGGVYGKESARYDVCQLGFACGFIANASRSESITLSKIPKFISHVITEDRIIGNSILEEKPIITSANLYTFKEWATTIEEKTFTVPANTTFTMTFEDYVTGFQVTQGNATVQQLQPYRVVLQTGNNTEIKAKVATAKRTFDIKTIQNTRTKASGENIKDYKDFFSNATDENDAKIDRSADIKKFIESKGVVKAKIVLNGEKCGDLVRIVTAYNGIVEGIITKMDVSFGFNDVADVEIQEWE